MGQVLVQMHAEIQIQSSTYFCERTRFFAVKEMAIEREISSTVYIYHAQMKKMKKLDKKRKKRKKEKRNFVFWNRTTSTVSIDLLCWNEYRVTLLSSPRWLNTVTGDETGLTSQLISTPSLSKQPMKGCSTTPESTPPTLYDQQCGFFYVLQESEQWKSCETEPTVNFSSLSKKTRMLNHL